MKSSSRPWPPTASSRCHPADRTVWCASQKVSLPSMIDIERREKYTHTGTIAESGAISNHVITARWHHPRQSYVLAIWPPRRRRWRRSRAHSDRRLLWPWRAHGRCSPTTPRRSPPLREQARRCWRPQAWWARSQLLRQPSPLSAAQLCLPHRNRSAVIRPSISDRCRCRRSAPHRTSSRIARPPRLGSPRRRSTSRSASTRPASQPTTNIQVKQHSLTQ